MDETGKMSKSKGATLTVSVLKEKGYDPLAFRYMCLTSHYRKQLVFSYEGLEQASLAYQKLKSRIKNLKKEEQIQDNKIKEYKEKFKESLSNDLNTANAITLIYDILKDQEINGTTKLELIKDFDTVLSLDLLKIEQKELDETTKKYIEDQIKIRTEAKQNKDYTTADKIRKDLEQKGIKLIDTKDGTTYQII